MIKLFHVNVKRLKKLLHEQGKSLHQVTRAMDYHQLDKQLENGRPVTKETLERLALKAGIRNKNDIVQDDGPHFQEPAKKQTADESHGDPEIYLRLTQKNYETLEFMASINSQTVKEYAQNMLNRRATAIRETIKNYTD